MNMKKTMIKMMSVGFMMVCMAATPVFAANTSSSVTVSVSTYNGKKTKAEYEKTRQNRRDEKYNNGNQAEKCKTHGIKNCKKCAKEESKKYQYEIDYENNKNQNDKQYQTELKNIEDQKKALNKQLQDELKRLEELKKQAEKKYQAQLKKLEDAKKIEEKRYQAQQKRIEEARVAAEKKRIEEERKEAEEKRKYEEWKKQELAKEQEKNNRREQTRVPSVKTEATESGNRRQAIMIK